MLVGPSFLIRFGIFGGKRPEGGGGREATWDVCRSFFYDLSAGDCCGADADIDVAADAVARDLILPDFNSSMEFRPGSQRYTRSLFTTNDDNDERS